MRFLLHCLVLASHVPHKVDSPKVGAHIQHYFGRVRPFSVKISKYRTKIILPLHPFSVLYSHISPCTCARSATVGLSPKAQYLFTSCLFPSSLLAARQPMLHCLIFICAKEMYMAGHCDDLQTCIIFVFTPQEKLPWRTLSLSSNVRRLGRMEH